VLGLRRPGPFLTPDIRHPTPIPRLPGILEGRNAAFLYQNDKDWHYRKEERRWVPMNDQSAWNRVAVSAGKMVTKRFHIR
jgi:hypothetical protein